VRLQKEREELATQEERSRVAREPRWHRAVIYAVLNLEKRPGGSNDPKLGQRLKGLVTLAKETLLRSVTTRSQAAPTSFRPHQHDRGPIREFSAVSGLPVELEVEGEERKVPIAVGSTLYRIAQEALANVYRHAEASTIGVRLAFCDDSVSLEVRDNGRGFAIGSTQPGASGGRGLRNMQQRAGELAAARPIE
jgi:hypothetical protein